MTGPIFVCGVHNLEYAINSIKPDSLISVVQESYQPDEKISSKINKHLRISIDDIVDKQLGKVIPTKKNVEILLKFFETMDLNKPTVIHCLAGISRSSACALILRRTQTDIPDIELVSKFRSLMPHAHPNKLLIEYADSLLNRKGELIASLKKFPSDSFNTQGPISLVPHLK